MNITDRQQKLLNAIINEFINTAEAVGSINLLDKYDFRLSSATIRNEMAELVIRGYLYKKHSSAGRIPTTSGWKFFVDKVREEIDYINASSELKNTSNIESQMFGVRDEKKRLIRETLNFLSILSENATVALIGNELYYSGLSSLTNIPEMQDADNLRRILRILEDYYTLSEIFHSKNKEEEINILIGEEDTGKEVFKDYSVIFRELRFNDKKGFIAVIGPNRMNYKKIISAVKYITETLANIIQNQNKA